MLNFILVSCGKISAPSIVSPDLNMKKSLMKSMVLVLLHTNILKKYLISELSNHEETKIEFVNEHSD